jgi:hypothetical protein
MSNDIASMANDVLYKAIKDITGLQFDGMTEAEDQALKVVIQKILSDDRTADEFVRSVASYSNTEAADISSRSKSYRSVELPTVTPQSLDGDPTMVDFPTDAWLNDTELPDALERILPAIDKSHITISPKSLGFSPDSDLLDWRSNVRHRWHAFLLNTEKQVKAKSPDHALLKQLKRKVKVHIVHRGANYSVLDLEAPASHSTTHFLFDPENLYVVIFGLHGDENRFSVPIHDSDTLAAGLIEAFDGRTDYAEFALSSMKKAFAY